MAWRNPQPAKVGQPEGKAFRSLEDHLKTQEAADATASGLLSGRLDAIESLLTLPTATGYALDAPPLQVWERTASLAVTPPATWTGDAGSFSVVRENKWLRSGGPVAVSAFSTSRFTVDTAGWYRISLNTQWATNSTGGRGVRLSHTAGNKSMGSNSAAADLDPDQYTATRVIEFAAGNSFGIQFWQNGAASLDMTYCQMTIEYL